MNVKSYQNLKTMRLEEQTEALKRLRGLCLRCRKALKTCFCGKISPFSTGPLFVILMHPKESKKRVGTGRLTHLCISNSILIEGIDFSGHETIEKLISDPKNHAVVLYPGKQALDISQEAAIKLEAKVPQGKRLVIFVIDGTWFCAQKMLRVSSNLRRLPQISFIPPNESHYQIRRQPNAICFSTVEAVHFIIGQLNLSERWKSEAGHDNLIEVFQSMVHQQLSHVQSPNQKAVRGVRVSSSIP